MGVIGKPFIDGDVVLVANFLHHVIDTGVGVVGWWCVCGCFCGNIVGWVVFAANMMFGARWRGGGVGCWGGMCDNSVNIVYGYIVANCVVYVAIILIGQPQKLGG